MDNGNRKDYWEYRTKLSYRYKGETFYTVTPAPLYYRRRRILLDLLNSIIDRTGAVKICDFGCGDGWYLNYLSRRYYNKKLFGVDLSESMIAKAREVCSEAELSVSGEGLTFEHQFDLIYAIAVFAHVMDDGKVEQLFNSICDHLDHNGHFVLFEQVGTVRQQWDNFIRRTSNDYISLASRCGLESVSRVLVAFPAHRFFEKRIATIFRRYFVKGNNIYESYINANRSYLYRAMSSLMVTFSGKPLRPDEGKLDGNVFIVFKKASRVILHK